MKTLFFAAGLLLLTQPSFADCHYETDESSGQQVELCDDPISGGQKVEEGSVQSGDTLHDSSTDTTSMATSNAEAGQAVSTTDPH